MKLVKIISEIKQIPHRLRVVKGINYYEYEDENYIVYFSTSRNKGYLYVSSVTNKKNQNFLSFHDLENFLKSKNIPFENLGGVTNTLPYIKTIYFDIVDKSELDEIKYIFQIKVDKDGTIHIGKEKLNIRRKKRDGNYQVYIERHKTQLIKIFIDLLREKQVPFNIASGSAYYIYIEIPKLYINNQLI